MEFFGARKHESSGEWEGEEQEQEKSSNRRRLQKQRTPSDPRFPEQWAMMSSQEFDLNAHLAWGLRFSTEGRQQSQQIVVGVVDTGVDYNHPDLRPNMWRNLGEIPNNGIDDDGNGFIDDDFGWNFFSDNREPMDTDADGHGTHCAGNVAASANNGEGVAGVAWNGKLMALKFMQNGRGFLTSAIRSINYAVSNGAHITSHSYGGGGSSSSLTAAIQSAEAQGHLLVAAAGNFARNNDDPSTTTYPCVTGGSQMICVASIGRTGGLSSFSNFGASTVEVAAPGEDILSTVPGGQYRFYTGTSMATPLVAGVAALLMDLNPALSAAQVSEIIRGTVRPLGSLSGRVRTGGTVDAYAAAVKARESLFTRQVTALPLVVGARSSDTFSLEIGASGVNLSPGFYQSLLVVAEDGGTKEVSAAVTLSVAEGPELQFELDGETSEGSRRFDFGVVSVGLRNTKGVTVTYNGDQSVDPLSVSVDGPGAAAFRVTPVSAVLTKGEKTQLDVSCMPTSVLGLTAEAALTVTPTVKFSDGRTTVTETLTVALRCVTAPPPLMTDPEVRVGTSGSFSSSAENHVAILEGATSVVQVRFSNTAGENEGAFSLQEERQEVDNTSPNSPWVLTAFTGPQEGRVGPRKQDVLEISCNEAALTSEGIPEARSLLHISQSDKFGNEGFGGCVIDLTCRNSAYQADMLISGVPSAAVGFSRSLDFGTLQLTALEDEEVKKMNISNNGNATLNLQMFIEDSQASEPGAAGDVFTVTPNSLRLPQGTHEEVTVSFKPTLNETVSYSAVLRLEERQRNSTISLSANSSASKSFELSVNELSVGVVALGSRVERFVTVENSGSGDLTLTVRVESLASPGGTVNPAAALFSLQEEGSAQTSQALLAVDPLSSADFSVTPYTSKTLSVFVEANEVGEGRYALVFSSSGLPEQDVTVNLTSTSVPSLSFRAGASLTVECTDAQSQVEVRPQLEDSAGSLLSFTYGVNVTFASDNFTDSYSLRTWDGSLSPDALPNPPQRAQDGWVDISGDSQSRLGSLDGDDVQLTGSLTIPFPLFGRNVSRNLAISSNGLIVLDNNNPQFGTIRDSYRLFGGIPNIGYPNGFVAPLWMDLNCASTCSDASLPYKGVFASKQKEESSVLLQWDGCCLYADPAIGTRFEAELSRSGRVSFRYRSIPPPPLRWSANLAVGIENYFGTAGKNVSGLLPNDTAVQMTTEITPVVFLEDAHNPNGVAYSPSSGTPPSVPLMADCGSIPVGETRTAQVNLSLPLGLEPLLLEVNLVKVASPAASLIPMQSVGTDGKSVDFAVVVRGESASARLMIRNFGQLQLNGTLRGENAAAPSLRGGIRSLSSQNSSNTFESSRTVSLSSGAETEVEICVSPEALTASLGLQEGSFIFSYIDGLGDENNVTLPFSVFVVSENEELSFVPESIDGGSVLAERENVSAVEIQNVGSSAVSLSLSTETDPSSPPGANLVVSPLTASLDPRQSLSASVSCGAGTSGTITGLLRVTSAGGLQKTVSVSCSVFEHPGLTQTGAVEFSNAVKNALNTKAEEGAPSATSFAFRNDGPTAVRVSPEIAFTPAVPYDALGRSLVIDENNEWVAEAVGTAGAIRWIDVGRLANAQRLGALDGCDDSSFLVDLEAFDLDAQFAFWGRPVKQMWVSCNGFVTFLETAEPFPGRPPSFGSSVSPNGFAAVWWDDLLGPSSSEAQRDPLNNGVWIGMASGGEGRDESLLCIQFSGFSNYAWPDETLNFQLQIDLRTQTLHFFVPSVPQDSARRIGTLVGLEGPSGPDGVSISIGDTPFAVSFTPMLAVTFSPSHRPFPMEVLPGESFNVTAMSIHPEGTVLNLTEPKSASVSLQIEEALTNVSLPELEATFDVRAPPTDTPPASVSVDLLVEEQSVSVLGGVIDFGDVPIGSSVRRTLKVSVSGTPGVSHEIIVQVVSGEGISGVTGGFSAGEEGRVEVEGTVLSGNVMEVELLCSPAGGSSGAASNGQGERVSGSVRVLTASSSPPSQSQSQSPPPAGVLKETADLAVNAITESPQLHRLDASGASLDFGRVRVGSEGTENVVWENRGTVSGTVEIGISAPFSVFSVYASQGPLGTDLPRLPVSPATLGSHGSFSNLGPVSSFTLASGAVAFVFLSVVPGSSWLDPFLDGSSSPHGQHQGVSESIVGSSTFSLQGTLWSASLTLSVETFLSPLLSFGGESLFRYELPEIDKLEIREFNVTATIDPLFPNVHSSVYSPVALSMRTELAGPSYVVRTSAPGPLGRSPSSGAPVLPLSFSSFSSTRNDTNATDIRNNFGAATPADDGFAFVELPFAFPFGGRLFEGLWLSSNGFLKFDKETTIESAFNKSAPRMSVADSGGADTRWGRQFGGCVGGHSSDLGDDGEGDRVDCSEEESEIIGSDLDAVLSFFWDDLVMGGSDFEGVYVSSDSTERRLSIEFVSPRHYTQEPSASVDGPHVRISLFESGEALLDFSTPFPSVEFPFSPSFVVIPPGQGGKGEAFSQRILQDFQAIGPSGSPLRAEIFPWLTVRNAETPAVPHVKTNGSLSLLPGTQATFQVAVDPRVLDQRLEEFSGVHWVGMPSFIHIEGVDSVGGAAVVGTVRKEIRLGCSFPVVNVPRVDFGQGSVGISQSSVEIVLESQDDACPLEFVVRTRCTSSSPSPSSGSSERPESSCEAFVINGAPSSISAEPETLVLSLSPSSSTSSSLSVTQQQQQQQSQAERRTVNVGFLPGASGDFSGELVLATTVAVGGGFAQTGNVEISIPLSGTAGPLEVSAAFAGPDGGAPTAFRSFGTDAYGVLQTGTKTVTFTVTNSYNRAVVADLRGHFSLAEGEMAKFEDTYTTYRGLPPRWFLDLRDGGGSPLAGSSFDSNSRLSAQFLLPFWFPFFDTSFDRLFVSSDGFLLLGKDTPSAVEGVERGGANLESFPVVAAFQTTLDCSVGSVLASGAHSDIFIVQWSQCAVERGNDTSSKNGEIWNWEGVEGAAVVTAQVQLHRSGRVIWRLLEASGAVSLLRSSVASSSSDSVPSSLSVDPSEISLPTPVVVGLNRGNLSASGNVTGVTTGIDFAPEIFSGPLMGGWAVSAVPWLEPVSSYESSGSFHRGVIGPGQTVTFAFTLHPRIFETNSQIAMAQVAEAEVAIDIRVDDPQLSRSAQTTTLKLPAQMTAAVSSLSPPAALELLSAQAAELKFLVTPGVSLRMGAITESYVIHYRSMGAQSFSATSKLSFDKDVHRERHIVRILPADLSLAPSEIYTFKVEAKGVGFSSNADLSPGLNVTIPYSEEAPVLSFSDVTAHSVRLSWTLPAGALSFSIRQRATDFETDFSEITSNLTADSFTVTGLGAAVRYEFQVAGVWGHRSKSAGPFSSAVSVTTSNGEPAGPSNVSVSVNESNYDVNGADISVFFDPPLSDGGASIVGYSAFYRAVRDETSVVSGGTQEGPFTEVSNVSDGSVFLSSVNDGFFGSGGNLIEIRVCAENAEGVGCAQSVFARVLSASSSPPLAAGEGKMPFAPGELVGRLDGERLGIFVAEWKQPLPSSQPVGAFVLEVRQQGGALAGGLLPPTPPTPLELYLDLSANTSSPSSAVTCAPLTASAPVAFRPPPSVSNSSTEAVDGSVSHCIVASPIVVPAIPAGLSVELGIAAVALKENEGEEGGDLNDIKRSSRVTTNVGPLSLPSNTMKLLRHPSLVPAPSPFWTGLEVDLSLPSWASSRSPSPSEERDAGLVLHSLQVELGRPPAVPFLTSPLTEQDRTKVPSALFVLSPQSGNPVTLLTSPPFCPLQGTTIPIVNFANERAVGLASTARAAVPLSQPPFSLPILPQAEFGDSSQWGAVAPLQAATQEISVAEDGSIRLKALIWPVPVRKADLSDISLVVTPLYAGGDHGPASILSVASSVQPPDASEALSMQNVVASFFTVFDPSSRKLSAILRFESSSSSSPTGDSERGWVEEALDRVGQVHVFWPSSTSTSVALQVNTLTLSPSNDFVPSAGDLLQGATLSWRGFVLSVDKIEATSTVWVQETFTGSPSEDDQLSPSNSPELVATSPSAAFARTNALWQVHGRCLAGQTHTDATPAVELSVEMKGQAGEIPCLSGVRVTWDFSEEVGGARPVSTTVRVRPAGGLSQGLSGSSSSTGIGGSLHMGSRMGGARECTGSSSDASSSGAYMDNVQEILFPGGVGVSASSLEFVFETFCDSSFFSCGSDGRTSVPLIALRRIELLPCQSSAGTGSGGVLGGFEGVGSGTVELTGGLSGDGESREEVIEFDVGGEAEGERSVLVAVSQPADVGLGPLGVLGRRMVIAEPPPDFSSDAFSLVSSLDSRFKWLPLGFNGTSANDGVSALAVRVVNLELESVEGDTEEGREIEANWKTTAGSSLQIENPESTCFILERHNGSLIFIFALLKDPTQTPADATAFFNNTETFQGTTPDHWRDWRMQVTDVLSSLHKTASGQFQIDPSFPPVLIRVPVNGSLTENEDLTVGGESLIAKTVLFVIAIFGASVIGLALLFASVVGLRRCCQQRAARKKKEKEKADQQSLETDSVTAPPPVSSSPSASIRDGPGRPLAPALTAAQSRGQRPQQQPEEVSPNTAAAIAELEGQEWPSQNNQISPQTPAGMRASQANRYGSQGVSPTQVSPQTAAAMRASLSVQPPQSSSPQQLSPQMAAALAASSQMAAAGGVGAAGGAGTGIPSSAWQPAPPMGGQEVLEPVDPFGPDFSQRVLGGNAQQQQEDLLGADPMQGAGAGGVAGASAGVLGAGAGAGGVTVAALGAAAATGAAGVGGGAGVTSAGATGLNGGGAAVQGTEVVRASRPLGGGGDGSSGVSIPPMQPSGDESTPIEDFTVSSQQNRERGQGLTGTGEEISASGALRAQGNVPLGTSVPAPVLAATLFPHLDPSQAEAEMKKLTVEGAQAENLPGQPSPVAAAALVGVSILPQAAVSASSRAGSSLKPGSAETQPSPRPSTAHSGLKGNPATASPARSAASPAQSGNGPLDMAGVEGDPSISTQEAGESGLALLPLGAAARGTQSGSSLAAPSGTVRTHTSPAVSGGSASKRSGASAHLSSSSSSSAHRSPQQPAAVVIPGAASATISGMDEGDGPQTVEERLDAGGEGEGEEVEWPEDDIVPEELMDSPDAPLLLPSAASPSSFSVHVRSPKGTLTSRVAGASKAGSTASGQKQKTVSLQGGGNSSTARSGERPVSALEAERERGQTGTNRSASLLSRGAQTVSAGFRSLAKAVGFGLSSSSSRGGQMKRKQSEEGEEEVDVEGFGFGPPRGAGEMTGRNGNGGVTVRSRLLGSDAGSPVVSVSSCRVNSAVDMSSPSFTEGEGAFPSDASGTSIPASSPWFGASSVIGQPQQLSPLHQGTPGSRDDQRRIHLSEGDGSKVFKGKSRMTEKETTKGDDKEEESPTKRATMV